LRGRWTSRHCDGTVTAPAAAAAAAIAAEDGWDRTSTGKSWLQLPTGMGQGSCPWDCLSLALSAGPSLLQKRMRTHVFLCFDSVLCAVCAACKRAVCPLHSFDSSAQLHATTHRPATPPGDGPAQPVCVARTAHVCRSASAHESVITFSETHGALDVCSRWAPKSTAARTVYERTGWQ